jgi:release factor glutamine methyltransferase
VKGVPALTLLRTCTKRLRAHGIEAAEKDAELIIMACSGMDRLALYRDDPPLDRKSTAGVEHMLDRRCAREPMAYILGHAEFCGLRIKVGPGVLIPRPETEFMVQELLNAFKQGPGAAPRVLDLCTGSGCLALAIARALPGADVHGSDISAEAIRFAGENARENGILNVTFHQGPLLEPVSGMRFDAIVSNPPYIRREDIDALQPEIRDWEPFGALDGGEDGLEYYREILAGAPDRLVAGGLIILEIGAGQADAVRALAHAAGFGEIRTTLDYSGIERILTAQ